MRTWFIDRIWRALAVLALPFGLTTCIYIPYACPPSAFEEAASYDWMLNDHRYSEPLNTWVRNERLESFLRKAYRSGGIDALKSQYGFDCAPRTLTPPCGDCYACGRSLPKTVDDAEGVGLACSKAGEMLMQVNIGPGRNSFIVWTYWKRKELSSAK
jgi:hypothetical protein